MGITISYAQGLIFLTATSMLAVTLAADINVGGSQGWRFGFNYANWTIQNAPFNLGDTLVFKYDPPNNTTFPHSVYLLPNNRSFMNCDLKKAKLIGKVTQGGKGGFRYVLKNWKPYYFACGERGGIHCKDGLMKFVLKPTLRCQKLLH